MSLHAYNDSADIEALAQGSAASRPIDGQDTASDSALCLAAQRPIAYSE